MAEKMPTVVVIDNSPAVRKLFERSTENLAIDLQVFATAEESWAFLRDHKPDLLILSIILPGKNGLIFLRELRNNPLHQDTSVIMVSTKDYTQDRRAASELGALDYISKPMPMQTITDVVVKYTKARPKSGQ